MSWSRRQLHFSLAPPANEFQREQVVCGLFGVRSKGVPIRLPTRLHSNHILVAAGVVICVPVWADIISFVLTSSPTAHNRLRRYTLEVR